MRAVDFLADFLKRPDRPSFSPEETMPLWQSLLHDFVSLFTFGMWRPFSVRRKVRKEAEAVRARFMADMREEASRLAFRVAEEAYVIAAAGGKTPQQAVFEAVSAIQKRVYANMIDVLSPETGSTEESDDDTGGSAS
jgi:hypothetical protein